MNFLVFSVDLQTTTKKQLNSYFELLAKYHMNLIFTSLIIGKNSDEDLLFKLQELTKLAKKYQISVFGEIDQNFLENYNLLYKKPKELINFFKNYGLSGIKVDQNFDLTNLSKLTYNNQDFKIIINGSYNIIELEKLILHYRINSKNVISCYNFYLQRYTAASIDFYLINQYESHINDIPFAGFVGTNKTQFQACSIEIHRDWTLINQIHHLIALGTDLIIVADQLLNEDQLKLLAEIDQEKVTLAIDIDKNISNEEKLILFNEKNHFVRPDLAQDLIISPIKTQSIEVRKNNQEYFEIGDVLICNETALDFSGQIQIVTKKIKKDDLRNLVGKIKEPYRSYFLSELKATRRFKFIK